MKKLLLIIVAIMFLSGCVAPLHRGPLDEIFYLDSSEYKRAVKHIENLNNSYPIKIDECLSFTRVTVRRLEIRYNITVKDNCHSLVEDYKENIEEVKNTFLNVPNVRATLRRFAISIYYVNENGEKLLSFRLPKKYKSM